MEHKDLRKTLTVECIIRSFCDKRTFEILNIEINRKRTALNASHNSGLLILICLCFKLGYVYMYI